MVATMRSFGLVLVSLMALPVAARADEGVIPKVDFPVVTTTAKPGEWVLSINKLQYDRFTKDPEKENVIFYHQEFSSAGPKESKFKDVSGDTAVPNSLIVPIAKGGKAKVGDIVLTWWQSGSGMQHAIVVEAKDGKAPTVRYLDIDYDNPAKGPDNKTLIGQMDEKLKADTFVVIKKPFDPGSTAACKDGSDYKLGHVIRVASDKVLLSGFAGHLVVRAKKDCKAMPLKPTTKAGAKVMAYWVGTMKAATVTKVDAKIGRIWVKYDGMGDKETALADGYVIDKL